MEDADLNKAAEYNFGSSKAESPEECEKQALAKGADGFLWCKPEQSCPQTCYAKVGNLKFEPYAALKTWAGLLPCP